MSDSSLIRRYFRVERREISYLRFTFEAYDGLLFMRTLNAADGLIEVAYPPSRREDAEAVLTAVATEVGMEGAEPPPAGEYDAI